MERENYSLIVVGDETSPIRRFDMPKQKVRRAVWVAGLAATVLLLGLVDYVRLRIEQLELDELRVTTAEQRAKIDSFDDVLGAVEGRLQQLREFERKVRIIANLPGSAATGGEEVVEVGTGAKGDLEAPPQGGDELPPPVQESAPIEPAGEGRPRADGAAPADPVASLRDRAEHLDRVAQERASSIEELIEELEVKRHRLASSPAIWPTKGWLTSRFGMRISPFTNRRQFHGGIDIAGAPGTDVVAPARGKVVFSGKRGPLGNSVIIEHGYGIRTMYGHNRELLVKRGVEVERGEPIATLGSTGRSTGPHLHYAVEVQGKAKNPLDYIFD
jgi:hypothetical protein